MSQSLENKTKASDALAFVKSGSPSWVRTNDLRINSPSLYRLSYRGINKFEELIYMEFCLAPRVGFEPTTCGLTVRRSTD